MDGRILVMYSNPTYDPNLIVNPDFDVAGEAMRALLEDPDQPLLNHAYQERFMPGSTFKVITTGIALEAGIINLDTEFERVSEWTPPQTSNPIQNYDGSNCGGDLPEVFRRSCNIPFAQTCAQRRRRRHDRGHPGVGHRPADPDRPPPAGRQHVRQHRQPRPAAPAPGDARVRAAGGPDGPAAHGHGRPGGGQRRRDDAAVRGRRHPRQPGPGAHQNRSLGLAAPDQPRRPRRRSTS